MKIKLLPCDVVFSQYIRLRDMRCMRCGSKIELNDRGMPVSHQNSHYFGRGRWTTRVDPENCDTLCMGCHRIWGSDDKEGYRQFKINQLGERGFALLELRANQVGKRDPKMALLQAQALLKSVLK